LAVPQYLNHAFVSIAPSKIPYVEISPIRLQTIILLKCLPATCSLHWAYLLQLCSLPYSSSESGGSIPI